MTPRIRNGLIFGGIGLLLNICVAIIFGFCGPVVSLLMGGLAGYFTAQQENLNVKGEGAKAGATSGAIAGGIVLIGQLIGGLSSLAIFQSGAVDLPFGAAPTFGTGSGEVAIYYLTGLAFGCCIGLVGVGLAALVGAGAGYLGTTEPKPAVS